MARLVVAWDPEEVDGLVLFTSQMLVVQVEILECHKSLHVYYLWFQSCFCWEMSVADMRYVHSCTLL